MSTITVPRGDVYVITAGGRIHIGWSTGANYIATDGTRYVHVRVPRVVSASGWYRRDDVHCSRSKAQWRARKAARAAAP